MVKWAAAAVFLMLLVGGAAALPAKQLHAPWALVVPEEVGFDRNGTGAVLYPLGDVDRDGFADLLAVNEDGVAFALAGPDLERIIWKSPAGGMWATTIPDADGDGVKDVWSFGDPSFRFSGQGVGQQGVQVSQQASQMEWPEQVLSGASGQQIATLRDSRSDTSARASVARNAGPAFVYTYATLADRETAIDMIVGVDQVWSIEVSQRSVRAVTFGPAPYMAQGAAWETITVAGRGLDGTERLRATFDDPARVLMYLAFLDVTGDDVADLVAVTVPRPVSVPTGSVSFGADQWTVYDGKDGSTVWSVSGEAVPRHVYFRELYLASLGDVDGDGRADLMAAEFEFNMMGFDERARIVSGADGSTLLQGPAETWFFPFGDVDGDGTAEFLKVRESSASDAYELELSTLGASLWKVRVDAYAEPVNFEWLEETASFSDLNADGAPDLLMWEWTAEPWDDPKAASIFFLIDGRTGEELWRRDVGPIFGASVHDVTGDGSNDLVYLAGLAADGTRNGYLEGTNHSMELVVHRGTDGKHVWSRTIIDQSLTAGRNMTRVDGWPIPAGDINGDGHGDVLVEMWTNCWFYDFVFASSPSMPDEETSCEPFSQYLVISGKDAALLHAVPLLASGGDPLPGVKRGEAFMEVESAEKEAPSPLPLLLVGLVAAALRRRR